MSKKKKPTWGAECVVGPPKGHHRGTYGGPHEKTMAGCLAMTSLMLIAPSAVVALIVKGRRR